MSTAHLLSLRTLPTAVMPAILLVAHRTASIARITAPIPVAEGKNLSFHETLKIEPDHIFRYYGDRDYDSDDDSRYRRRSTRYD